MVWMTKSNGRDGGTHAAAGVAGGGLAVALLTLVLMVATEPLLPIVWDEGFTLIRLSRVRNWILAVRDPDSYAANWNEHRVALSWKDQVRAPRASEIDTRSKLFSKQVIAWFWPFAREEPHGHPPFYALLGLFGDGLTPSRSELSRARLGAMLVFAATSAGLFAFLASRRGVWSGALAAGTFVLSPQLFAMGHYAHYDAPLTCLWVGSILAFAQAAIPRADAVNADHSSPRWGWVVFFGILAGAAAGTKLTGWLLPVPFLLWTVLYRERKGALTLAVGGLVAAATLYAVTPPWWHTPWDGLNTFFLSNLMRGKTAPVPIQFLGRIYSTPNQSLPWYNTLVWTVAASPVGFLAWGVAGWVRAARDRGDRFASLAVISWAFLLTLRALPHTPGHDGVRQILPAFGTLAIVSGLGVGVRPGLRSQCLIVAAMLEAVVSIAIMMPVPLSYFSPAVGGLPGATRLGFEPTYYWDTFTPGVIARINQQTAPGRSIAFSVTPFSYHYLQQSGQLRPEAVALNRFLPWQWYLIQNRPGTMTPLDRALIARHGQRRKLLSKLGVPLVWAFERGEVDAVAADIRSLALDPVPAELLDGP